MCRRRTAQGLFMAAIIGFMASVVAFSPSTHDRPAAAVSVPDAPDLKGNIRIVSDNDYALFAGDVTNVTRLVHQNNSVFWDQVADASPHRISLNENETYLYLLAMGGGGAEDIGGTLNGVDVSAIASGPNGIQRAVNPSGPDGYLTLEAGFTDWDALSHGNCDSGTSVCWGPYVARLNEVKPALVGATWGDPPATVWGQAVGAGEAAATFSYPDSRAVMFRIKGTALGNGAVTASGGTAHVYWTAPGSDGGSSILDYTATAYRVSDDSATGQSCTTTDGTTLDCTVAGLADGVPVYFRVSARNSAGSGAESAKSGPVNPVAPPPPPTTTTSTTTPTTTTTTVPPTTTTSAATSTTVALASTSSTSSSSSTTAVEAPNPVPAAPAVNAVWATTPTTIAPLGVSKVAPTTAGAVPTVAAGPVVTTTLPTPPTAPVAPEVGTNGVGLIVDGEFVQASVSRDGDVITIENSGMVITASGVSADNTELPLAADGSLFLQKSSGAAITVEGFEPSSMVSVWMFSTPSQLGTATTDATGKVSGTFPLPPGIKPGIHRLVLHGNDATGKATTFAVAATVYDPNAKAGSRINPALITLPLLLAAFGALFLPAVLRRRRGLNA